MVATFTRDQTYGGNLRMQSKFMVATFACNQTHGGDHCAQSNLVVATSVHSQIHDVNLCTRQIYGGNLHVQLKFMAANFICNQSSSCPVKIMVTTFIRDQTYGGNTRMQSNL
jgi:hypothetical protein